MFVLRSGRVRITKQAKEGPKTLAMLGPGEFFGEMAILNNKPRSATATVVEDARLLELDSRTFEQMVAKNSEIAVRLIKRLSRRLDAADELIDILMHRDPKARVILGISREAEVQGTVREDGSVLLPLDQNDLARQVGLAPDEVKGVLARLHRLGIVGLEEDGFVVPDRMRLHEFLEFLQSRERLGDA
jgi:CRP-like cAMP-binding protein